VEKEGREARKEEEKEGRGEEFCPSQILIDFTVPV